MSKPGVIPFSVAICLAVTRPVAADPQATVWVRNPAAVREILPAADFKVLDAKAEQEQWARAGYLPPLKRNSVFRKLQMEGFVAGWDDLDKDILVMSSKAEDFSLLKKQYPKIPAKILQQLQNEVRELTKR